MVELQIISQVLQTGDISIIQSNQLTKEYFNEYPEEYEFIIKHYEQYGNVPDKLSFLSNFQEFEVVEVNETEQYLVDKIREEYLYRQTVPVIQQSAKLLSSNSNEAVEYMLNAMSGLKPNYSIGGTDIVAQASERLEAYKDKKEHQDNWFFPTGFSELDNIIHGINRAEELMLIYARLNEGKSWVLEYICANVWKLGYNIGYISPEMGALSVGYRFDTIIKHFSNSDLVYGNDGVNEDEYVEYLDELKTNKNKFIVATPTDFNNRLTCSKIRQFIQMNNIHLLAIDGVNYLEDEKYHRGDTEAQKLTHLGIDLWSMARELQVPIIVVAQANRGGAIDKENDDTPGIESVRGGDGISINASKIIAMKQSNDGVITFQVKKQRNGRVGDKIRYQWNPNIAEFISEVGTSNNNSSRNSQPKRKIEKKEDVF